MSAAASDRTILIVDDDPDIVLGLQDLLVHDEYRVDSAGTCAAAIARARERRYNAVLLDLSLPDGDGLSVLKMCQELDPTLPVIVLTASATAERTIGTLTEGAFAYLIKPYNRDELRATIRRAVGVQALAVRAEHVEHALTESEERFRSLVESATDAIVLSNHDGLIMSWNNAASRLFGYTDAEAIGRSLTLLMPVRYRAAHMEGLKRVHATNQPRLIGKVTELVGLRKDGTEFPIELSLATWRTAEGSFYSGIIRDISERKGAESALLESQERFRQLAENIREVFWLSDLSKNRIFYVSPGYEDVWGRSCESLYASPRSWTDAIHPDDRERVLTAAIHRQISGEYNEEYRIIRTNGTTRWIWDRAFPIRDGSGQIYRIAGLAEDVTEQKEREALLRASEERLRLALAGAQMGIWDWTVSNGSVFWSTEVETFFGLQPGSFPGTHAGFLELVCLEDRGLVLRAIQQALERRTPVEFEHRVVRSDGTLHWLSWSGAVYRDPYGAPYRVLGTVRDITGRKRA